MVAMTNAVRATAGRRYCRLVAVGALLVSTLAVSTPTGATPEDRPAPVLAATASISGTVTEDVGGTPLAGVEASMAPIRSMAWRPATTHFGSTRPTPRIGPSTGTTTTTSGTRTIRRHSV